MKHIILMLCAAAFCVLGASAAETLLLDGWRFFKGGAPGAEKPSFDDSSWQTVRIPHDWAIGGEFDRSIDLQVTAIRQDGEVVPHEHTGRTGALPWPGEGWYRRRVEVPSGIRHAELVFDGAMNHPVVYVNGEEAGRWENGYNSFVVDVSRFLDKGEGTSVLSVAVHLTNPPNSSRWYPGSGLFRPVRLVVGGEEGLATWGTFVRTTRLSEDEGRMTVSTRVRGARKGSKVRWRLSDPSGTCVAEVSRDVMDGEASAVLTVANPHPWTPETPSLYSLETVLVRGSEVLDRNVTRTGLRTVAFTGDGFMLNGKRRAFRGVCMHHDFGPLGAAFSTAAFRRQLRLLRELGCDSIRTSHNMPAPWRMDICDEEGFMVMAESFDMWVSRECANDYSRDFPEWWERDLTNLLECHRNHPSIVMWSIGNEIHENDASIVRRYAKLMTELCHRLDPSRPVTLCTDRPDAYTAAGALQVLDVPALTYRLPRYGFMHENSPCGIVLGGETASTFSSRGAYHFPAEPKPNATHPDGQSSSYDLEHGSWSNLPDDDWAMQDDHSWAVGEFVWTGFDYLGEPTPYKEYWPSRSSYFGIFDLAGLPKDRYWLYRSRWNRESPTLHVLPHWTWPGREGEVTPVYCYTSYPSAELFVNGRSQGRRTKDASTRLDRYRLRWNDVRYEPGELKVVAYDASGRQMGERVVRTAGAPHHLSVKADRTCLVAPSLNDTPDLAFVTVRVVDNGGMLCPNAAIRLCFSASGAVGFKAACNGDATSLESFGKPTMLTFNGELVVVVEAESIGEGRLSVSSEGFPSAEVKFTVKRMRRTSFVCR